MRGPIDYIVVGFNGSNLDGKILKEIGQAIDNRTIDLVALSAISKNKEGQVTKLNINNLPDSNTAEFNSRYQSASKPVSDEDLAEISDLMDNDTTAGVLIIEQLWAKPLKKAMLDAHGFLVAEGRIHPEAAKELEEGG